ncbi:MAG: hypothetical protein DRP74_07090 [Candidatus Omnitrophota bacterium]|nr:MAG: hypothetical protein DRP74_07090 [Candidatus Omnitrophota bacterium]
MLLKLLGWFWITSGVIFLIKPEMLRKRLQKKSVKKLKKILFAVVLAFSFLLIAASLRSEGILAKVIMLIGIIGIFKGFFLLKAKSSDKIIEWYANQSLIFFRVSACLQVVIGVLILVLRK